MEITHTHSKSHTGYGGYVLIWLILIGLTVLTVSVSGIDFGNATLPLALLIATIKSVLVINIFMHIKHEDKIFRLFIGVALLILIVAFVFTAFDVFFR
ncbi:MAG: coxD [Ignavibacteria bacterium]|nr:coxD [Ignavibacteria bacterium]